MTENQPFFLLFARKQVLNSPFLLLVLFPKRVTFYLAGQITFSLFLSFLPQGWMGCLGCLCMAWADGVAAET